jgi:hypothetical protein
MARRYGVVAIFAVVIAAEAVVTQVRKRAL